VCEICNISRDDFKIALNIISQSKNFGALHGMGITQHIKAVESVHALLNLLILKNGKILSCRGEVNVQGCGDMGCIPNIDVEWFERIWSVKLTRKIGVTMIGALSLSPVKASFISGFNPAQSMPDLNRVHKNLEEMFIVQMDSYLNLTSKFADVILPTPTLLERNGTITNGERRVRLVTGVIEPLGESKQEWQILKTLARMLGFGKYFPYKNVKDIFKEITHAIRSYSKINVDSLYKGKDHFADKSIKFKKFVPSHFTGVEDMRSEKYPFILTTFRSKYQFLTGEMTSKSKTLKKVSGDGAYCYISDIDAKKLRLCDGDDVIIESRTGRVKTKIKIDTRMQPGVVATHFHFEKLLVNKLFPSQFDTRSLTPNYKLVAVAIRKVKNKKS
jgi:predicted molibdopterin-dependent oxidoreductase YjgC